MKTSTATPTHDDPFIQLKLDELASTIRDMDSSATFELVEGEDPEGLYLWVMTDRDDPDEILDAVIDQVIDLQVKDDMSLFVVPLPASPATPRRARRSVSPLLSLLPELGAPETPPHVRR